MSVDLRTAQRVAVIGCSGAGKSVFSKRLVDVTGLPLIHLDQEYWQPQWAEPARDAWLQRTTALVKADRWISDGNFGSTIAIRARRADAVVFLDYPTMTCLSGVVRRTLRYHGRRRPDMAAGCHERWDWPFLRFVCTFRRVHRPRILMRLVEAQAMDRTIISRNRKMTERLLHMTGQQRG